MNLFNDFVRSISCFYLLEKHRKALRIRMKGQGLRKLLGTCFGLAATDLELLEAKEESRSCRGVPKSVPKGRVGRIAECALAASLLRFANVTWATGRWAQEWRCGQGGQIQMNPAVHHFFVGWSNCPLPTHRLIEFSAGVSSRISTR